MVESGQIGLERATDILDQMNKSLLARKREQEMNDQRKGKLSM